jgi:glycosyltransferase involved in cell wall biosynthesis
METLEKHRHSPMKAGAQQLNVLLLANYPRDRQESMLRFSDLLENRLSMRQIRVETIRPRAFFGRLFKSLRGLGKLAGYFDKYAIFPWMLHKRLLGNDAPDIVHIADHSNAVYVRHLNPLSCVVTCHDLLAVRAARGEFSDQKVRWSGRFLQSQIVKGLERADHVVCDSKATRRDLLGLSGVQANCTSVIYLGLNNPFHRMPWEVAMSKIDRLINRLPGNIRSKLRNDLNPLDGRGFLLHVGSDAWYKNRMGLCRIYHELQAIKKEIPLLICAGHPFSAEMQQWIRRKGLQDAVISLTGALDDEICALYSMAQCLVFPSRFEGFGWPILEAFACGCRVFTTKREPMTEIGGDAAVYADTDVPQDAARRLLELLTESPTSRHMRQQNGLEIVSNYSSERMVAAYAQMYADMANNRRSAH